MDTTATEKRLVTRIDWYDVRAVQAKRLHLICQNTSLGLSIALVGLISVDAVPRLFLSLLAACLAFAVGIERISRWGDKWRLYRLTAEALQSEYHLYLAGAGPYAIDPINRDRALAERVEQILKGEAQKWQSLALSQPETEYPLGNA